MIDRNETIAMPIIWLHDDHSETIVVIEGWDMHEEKSNMQRLQCYNQLYFLGAGLKKKRLGLMREWQAWQAYQLYQAKMMRQACAELAQEHAQEEWAMQRLHATINFIFWALVSRESTWTHGEERSEHGKDKQDRLPINCMKRQWYKTIGMQRTRQLQQSAYFLKPWSPGRAPGDASEERQVHWQGARGLQWCNATSTTMTMLMIWQWQWWWLWQEQSWSSWLPIHMCRMQQSKRGNHVGLGKHKKCHKKDEFQATMSKKPWVQCNEHQHKEKGICDDHEHHLHDKAHAILCRPNIWSIEH
jgi:hypothetical protein